MLLFSSSFCVCYIIPRPPRFHCTYPLFPYHTRVRSPTVFGYAAPDRGNADILAMYGSDAQKQRYLQPLLDGEICSCFSMTEPQAGADPKEFTCTATRDGDGWVINGEKWYSSNARYAADRKSVV